MAKVQELRRELATAEATAKARRQEQARKRQAALAARRQAAGLRRVTVWVGDEDAELVRAVLSLDGVQRAQLAAALRPLRR